LISGGGQVAAVAAQGQGDIHVTKEIGVTKEMHVTEGGHVTNPYQDLFFYL
jgi:hypothetical protein